MQKINWSLLFLLWVFISCTSENPQPDPSSLGYQYFPLQKGDFREYEVQYIEYNLSGNHDTLRYQLKEVLADTFQNLENGLSYRLERFKRSDETENWKIDSVWTARTDLYTAVQVEHNLPLIKLSFPVQENKSWNVNALNSKDEDEFIMMDINMTFQVNDTTTFDNTLTVLQNEVMDNILFRNVAREVFKEDVGLVYKEQILINYCADVECLGQEEIESGFDYRQILTNYGEE